MAQGTLEVLLVGAKGLENTDYLCTNSLASFFFLFEFPRDRSARLYNSRWMIPAGKFWTL
jgi:hypothetical protein